MQYNKQVRYDAETKDYAMYLDDEYIGSEPTHFKALNTLDQIVYDLLAKQGADAEPSYELTPVTSAPAHLIAIVINGTCRGYALNYADAEIMAKALIAEE